MYNFPLFINLFIVEFIKQIIFFSMIIKLLIHINVPIELVTFLIFYFLAILFHSFLLILILNL
jgi:hypothetical protein